MNREFKTARMWILAVNHEKKMARKFPGLQYLFSNEDSCLLYQFSNGDECLLYQFNIEDECLLYQFSNGDACLLY